MFNEVYNKDKIRIPYTKIMDWANSITKNIIVKKKNEAENLFKKIGITFSVYNNFDTSERLIPFDMFPRILTSLEWKRISKGISNEDQGSAQQYNRILFLGLNKRWHLFFPLENI